MWGMVEPGIEVMVSKIVGLQIEIESSMWELRSAEREYIGEPHILSRWRRRLSTHLVANPVTYNSPGAKHFPET